MRLQSNPKDYTFQELQSLMSKCGFKLDNKGKTSGSRVSFKGNKTTLRLHKPHNYSYLKNYQIKDVIIFLTQEGVI